MSGRRLRLGVAARIVMHDLLLFAIVVATVVLVDRLLLRPAMQSRVGELSTWFGRQATGHRDEPARLAQDFAEMHRILHLDLTLYDRDGAMAATNVTPPLPKPSAAVQVRLSTSRAEWIDENVLAMPLRRGDAPDGFVVLRNVPPPLPLDFAMTLLIAAVVGIALLSIPLTRSMLRPLRELMAVTRGYAGGDTSARARLRRDDEFGDLANAFNQMIDRVDLMRRSEKQLLANVSHELRTPLARVRVLLELGSDGSPSQASEVLPEIAQDLAELERLVDDVLTTVRLELSSTSGGAAPIEMPMHFEQHDLQDIVRRWQERFSRQHPDRALVLHCAGSLPTLRCDPVLLRRAVDNLLDNAARYAPAPGPVELHVRSEAGMLHIEVVDHGPGIAAKDLERIFEPFYRVEESRDRRLGGVGLGLPLAKRIIEAHGGHISLHSTPNVGTRAVVELPA